jgi:hypothetical protein
LKQFLLLQFLITAAIISASDKLNDLILCLDGKNFDMDCLKSILIFVNFVCDRNDADVIQIFTFEKTGCLATEFAIISVGNNHFVQMKDTTYSYFPKTESFDVKRESRLKGIKNGLLPFLIESDHK